MHGGTAKSGPANSNWIDGRKSKVMPKRLLEGYQASLNNPDRLALDEEIAVLDTRLDDLLQRVDTGESGQLWRMLKQAARDYEVARHANNSVAVVETLSTILELINRGHTDIVAWTEVRQVIQDRRRTVESERKRQVQMHELISSEVAMGLMAQLVVAVQTHVNDDDTVAAIASEYARLIGA